VTNRNLVCGMTLETGWPLITPLLPTTKGPDLRFVVTTTAPGEGSWQSSREATWPDGRRYLAVGRIGDVEVIRFRGVGDAWFMADDLVVFHLTHRDHDDMVEGFLLGPLLATWLERNGRVVLHGAAAVDNGRAIGFLGRSGVGKSTLAMGLVERGGLLITDDLLAICVDGGRAWTHPSFSQLRLWPDDARRFIGSIDGLEPTYPGNDKLRLPLSDAQFASDPVELTALYLPQRDPNIAEVKIEPMTGADALFALLLDTFAEELISTTEHRRSWVAGVGRLLSAVPLFRLTYPDDAGAVDDVAATVVAHAGRQSKPVAGGTAVVSGR